MVYSVKVFKNHWMFLEQAADNFLIATEFKMIGHNLYYTLIYFNTKPNLEKKTTTNK